MKSAAPISRGRRIVVFLFVLVVGFLMFAGPATVLQMGYLGGYVGPNLALLGLVQLFLVTGVVGTGLRMLDMRPPDIGWTSHDWERDTALGGAVALLWAAVQFGWLIPATGGATRPDVASVIAMIDGRWANLLWYLPLGILGGGVAEEVYGRGFVITALKDILGGSTTALLVAGVFSAGFFAAGHLPQTWVMWVDIMVPSVAYVALFLYTGTLTAPVVAHATWNTLAVIGVHLAYP